MNPPSVWKRSHDHHHRHNSRDFSPNIGSFPLMTVADYAAASFAGRLAYCVSRHPLTLALGYFTVFAGKMSLLPFLRNPRRHFDAGLALAAHAGFAWLVFADFDSLLLGWIVPFAIGSAAGSYLFYAQHNFPGVRLQTAGQWNYVFSALHSSSYLAMGPVLSWFAGNIGYHHVHHLNARIPFYRLPEAMAAIEELQSPATTTLALRDIAACLSLKLWDPDRECLVGWPKAARAAHLPAAAGAPVCR
jgi:omega-6 fatty acid desaturase (delta-12 desaturase)